MTPSGTFKVGDLVVCVIDDPCPIRGGTGGYRKGAVYRVAMVKSGRDDFGRRASGLKAVGFEDQVYRNVICFKHLPPDEPAFVEQVRPIDPAKLA